MKSYIHQDLKLLHFFLLVFLDMSLNISIFAEDNSSIAECKSPTVNPIKIPFSFDEFV